MNTKTLKLIYLVPILIFTSFACDSPNESSRDKDSIAFINLFSTSSNKEASCYRIPALLKTQNGNLIAAIDERNISCGDLRSNKDINIVIRKSEDNGKSWSSPVDITSQISKPTWHLDFKFITHSAYLKMEILVSSSKKMIIRRMFS